MSNSELAKKITVESFQATYTQDCHKMNRPTPLRTCQVWPGLSRRSSRDRSGWVECFRAWCRGRLLFVSVNMKVLGKFILCRNGLSTSRCVCVSWSAQTTILLRSIPSRTLNTCRIRRQISFRWRMGGWRFSWCYVRSWWFFFSCSLRSLPCRSLSLRKSVRLP